jgi:glycerol uptake facilitator-like aquaporin
MTRRYLAELIGTFVIVFAPVALSATSSFQNGVSGLLAAALVSGLSVLAMIYTFGPTLRRWRSGLRWCFSF